MRGGENAGRKTEAGYGTTFSHCPGTVLFDGREGGGDIRNLRKEFQENFAEGSDNLEALRSSMGDTVKVLVTAVTNDRELTKKLCVAVERFESEEGQN